MQMNAAYVSDRQIAGRYDISRPTVWAWLKTDPTFPKPVKLSPGCTRWKIADLEDWEAKRRTVCEAA